MVIEGLLIRQIADIAEDMDLGERIDIDYEGYILVENSREKVGIIHVDDVRGFDFRDILINEKGQIYDLVQNNLDRVKNELIDIAQMTLAELEFLQKHGVDKFEEKSPGLLSTYIGKLIHARYSNVTEYAQYHEDSYNEKCIASKDGEIYVFAPNAVYYFERGVYLGLDFNYWSDTDQKIYNFYEEDIYRYLLKIGSDPQRIIDDQGADWYRIKLDDRNMGNPINI